MYKEKMFCNIDLHMKGKQVKGHFEFNGDGVYAAAVLGVILKELHVHEYDEETAITILSSALDMAEQIAADEAAESAGVLN
jgi:hypothetical protein